MDYIIPIVVILITYHGIKMINKIYIYMYILYILMTLCELVSSGYHGGNNRWRCRLLRGCHSDWCGICQEIQVGGRTLNTLFPDDILVVEI